MNIKMMLPKTTILLLVVLAFVGCDKDFETIGSNIIGEPGFNAALYDAAKITATTNKLPPVQTNNLPINLLGVNKDAVFGNQTASILTQVNLSSPNPDFGTDPVLDSVVLHIPYFYTEVESDIEGEVLYELDSVYGEAPIKLSIIRSNLFLTDFDPETDFETAQKYFSNMQPQIEANLGEVLYQTDNFVPSSQKITVYGENDKGEADTLSLTPRMRIKLPTQFFQENIISKEGTSVLASNNNFRNFFRGLFFKAEAVNSNGNTMLLNLKQSDAGITLYYTSQVVDTQDKDDDDDTEELIPNERTYVLNFGPTTVNTFVQETPVFEDENLYLKGGEGSMAIIELFSGVDSDGDGVSDELEYVRSNDWLINEANLTFYVNQNIRNGNHEPKHIYLYDIKNNTVLADYILDRSTGENDPTSTTNILHLKPLERDEDGNGILYNIRITNHIHNVLTKDSTNVKLGLVVSQNINEISNSAVLDPNNPLMDYIPTTSVISPHGTILYGPKAQDEEKQLKLRIYYSEPKK